jgi:tetratricopeptide (TPR) repeat protein
VDFGLRPTEDGTRLARDAIAKALALKPDYGPLYARMSRIAVYDGDVPAAAMHATHALTLDPTDSDTLEVAQLVARRLGKLDQAIALSEYQIAGDPLNVMARENLGHAYRYAGRLDDAIDQFRIVLSLSPN